MVPHCGQGNLSSQGAFDSARTLPDTELVKGKKKGVPERLPTLDLHGYKTDEVFDAVEAFLRRYESSRQVRIMPGKGTGKVKEQVIDYLKKAHYPWSYERLPNGQNNEGVMIVYME
jgi:dsDNA-specific endonuclease/ATPase MutS2